MATIINCTPHAVTLIDSTSVVFNPSNRHWEGTPVVKATFAPSGILPRCRQTEEVCGEIDGIEVVKTVFGEVEGLPEPVEGTFYIVSSLVAQAAKGRDDLLIPGRCVRNEAGQVLGCTCFGRV